MKDFLGRAAFLLSAFIVICLRIEEYKLMLMLQINSSEPK